jgi:hypothetical protein
VRFPARFFCQGRPLRSRERKLRGLDSASGKAPGTATKGICFFFQAEIALEKGKKEGTKCQKDNTSLGENYCRMRSKSRAECSKPTPLSTITPSGMLCLPSNSAYDATYNPIKPHHLERKAILYIHQSSA